MTTYDGLGRPLLTYRGDGVALNVYDGLRNLLSGAGPLPPAPANPLGLAVNEFPQRMGPWFRLWDQCLKGQARASALIAGHSLSAGYTASLTGNIDHVQFQTNGWVFRLRDDVAGRLGDAGEGVIAFSDPRVTVSGSPQRLQSFGPGLFSYRMQAAQSIQVVRVKGPSVGLMWRHEAGVTQPPTVVIDGSVTWTPTATGVATGDYVVDFIHGLSDTSHTVVINGPASSRCDVSCLIAGGLDTIHRLSSPGGFLYNIFPTNADGANEAEVFKHTLDRLDVDLLGLAFVHNEATAEQNLGTAITPAQLVARYKRVFDYQINTRGKSAVVVAGPARTGVTGTYSMDDYWDALRELVASYPERCDFIDFRTVLGKEYVASKYWDTVHPRIETHEDMKNIARDSLFPVGAALAYRLAQAA